MTPTPTTRCSSTWTAWSTPGTRPYRGPRGPGAAAGRGHPAALRHQQRLPHARAGGRQARPVGVRGGGRGGPGLRPRGRRAARRPGGPGPGSTVAVVGGTGLLRAVEEVGLHPVPVVDVRERPAAVVQGFSPDLGWAQLAAATAWVRDGVTWVASNLDLTIPTARGIAPGNGLLVHAVAEASGSAAGLRRGQAGAVPVPVRRPLGRLRRAARGRRPARHRYRGRPGRGVHHGARPHRGARPALDALDAEPSARPGTACSSPWPTSGTRVPGPGPTTRRPGWSRRGRSWTRSEGDGGPEAAGERAALRERWAGELSTAAG